MDSVAWGNGREADFVAWIDAQLLEAQTARVGLDRQHREWLSQYRVSAKNSTRRFPYEGASNYTLPLTAIDVDILYASFMQTVHAPENVWSVSPLNERWQRAAKPLQDFLTLLDQRVLKMYNVNKRVFLETTKLGTGIYKTGWTYERRPIWTYDSYGKRIRATKIVSVPYVDHVRLSDFYMPAYSYALQPDDQGGAPWTAERMRVPLGRLYALAEQTTPAMPAVRKDVLDLIRRFDEADKPPMDVKIQELDFARRGLPSSPTKLEGDDFDRDQERGSPGGMGLQRPHEIELWEIHARFPTRDGHSEDDVEVWYHQPTKRVVRAMYSRYHHGKRPYDKIVYLPGDGFFGVGVCEQKEMFQTLGSDLANFTLDNVLLANSRVIVASQDANIGPGEPWYPGKTIVTSGDVRQQFGMFPMSDIYPSLPMIQSFFGALGEKRTGIGDIQAGQLQNLPGRTPATTMMSLLAEGKRRPDLTIKDMRYEGLSAVGLKVLQMCQQYIASPVNFEGEAWLQMMVDTLGMPEGAAVAEKFRMPAEPVELGIGVALTATSSTANKEIAQQGALALLQLSTQIGPQMIQLIQVAQQAQGTPLGDIALNIAQGTNELYRQTLEAFDKRDLEQLLPLGDALAPQTADATNGAPAQPLPAGIGGDQGSSFDPALAAILSGAESGG